MLNIKSIDKSTATNFIASILVLLGYYNFQLFNPIVSQYLFSIGIFALSGSVTNWLAIYMLFEKIPYLYGSGVIPTQFESFKAEIKKMLLKQFFAKQYLDNILASKYKDFIKYGVEKIDYSALYESLVESLVNSSFGQMLSMFGGKKMLEPMKEPIIAKLKLSIANFSNNIDLNADGQFSEIMLNKIELLLDQRLAMLTPEMVKMIVQNMIKKHLGWLVVWGGVLGGVIGLFSQFMLFMF